MAQQELRMESELVQSREEHSMAECVLAVPVSHKPAGLRAAQMNGMSEHTA